VTAIVINWCRNLKLCMYLLHSSVSCVAISLILYILVEKYKSARFIQVFCMLSSMPGLWCNQHYSMIEQILVWCVWGFSLMMCSMEMLKGVKISGQVLAWWPITLKKIRYRRSNIYDWPSVSIDWLFNNLYHLLSKK